jgi:hypothetical protein
MTEFVDKEPGPGRPTIDNDWLSSNRDALLGMLSSRWAQIGWQLRTAGSREDLRQALHLVKDHPDKNRFARLLRPTESAASTKGIRIKRKAVKEAVKRRFIAQTECDKCVSGCREIEMAMNQATPDQMEYVQREFSRRRVRCQDAQDQLRRLKVIESDLEEELANAEAAFAQDQLLEFIAEKKYALTPFNLANAMAGLPYARDVEFLGVWVSRERCAKIECRFWPNLDYQVFETIETIWNDKMISASSPVDFFRQRIAALPKTRKATIPQERAIKGKKKRVPNSVRQRLADNFFYLEQAIDKSLKSIDKDSRPMPFIILSNFGEILAKPRTAVDQVLAEARKITDSTSEENV